MSPRKAYQDELNELGERMNMMGSMAREAITLAAKSFEDLDLSLVERVRRLDEKAYETLVKTEKEIVKIIALHAPVAGDLRYVTTSLKITTDFDRIVRYAKDIAEITERAKASDLHHFKVLVSIPRISEMAVSMVDLAIESFLEGDLDKTEEVFVLEDKVDSLYDEIFREVLIYMMENSANITMGMNYQFVARYLERIADHACNIAERTVYMKTGERVEK